VVLRVRGDDAAKNAAKFKRYIESPALTNIKVAFKGFDAYDIQPSSVPDLFAERPVMVFGKYRGKAKGNVIVTGTSGHGKFKKVIRVSSVEEDKGNDALRYLWARQRIAFLDDLNSRNATQERKDHVTELGLKYNLLTAYTSFVAVDDTVRNAGGTSTTVQQPLPLPWGVSNFAVKSKRSRASNIRRPQPTHMKMSRGSGRGSGRTHTFSMQDAPMGAPMVAPEAVRPKDKEDTSSSTRPLLTTVGALTLQQAQAVLMRHRAFLAMSLKRLRAKKGKIRGPIVLALRVNAAGRVLSVVVQSGVLSQKDVDSYLTGQLKRMHFPSVGGNSTITITLRL
jgi:Ca-activated chloride channel family protein